MMKFAKEFFEVFLIVGLTSGFLLGILAYLFLVRVLNKREAIEASLERLRLNVLSHRIPLIEFTMPIIFVIDRFIYGFNFKHRFFGSAFIGFLITSASLIYLYNNYLTIDGSTRIEKLRMERATDPWLFDIATKQQYKIILEKAYFNSHSICS